MVVRAWYHAAVHASGWLLARVLAESVQRIIVRRALSGQYPQTQEQIIDWLEQTATGWNEHPTPFVWNGKRRRRRERPQLRRLAGSGVATRICNSIAS